MPRLQGPVGGETRPRRPRAVRLDISYYGALALIRDGATGPSSGYVIQQIVRDLKKHLAPWHPEFKQD
jgi:hypothetical protein